GAQEVMSNQPVEVIGTGGAAVYLVVADFRLLTEILAKRLRHSGGLLQRRAIRHIDDDLKLALIVEGEHFHAHPLQRNECNRCEQQEYHTEEEHPATPAIGDERVHHAAIQTRGPTFG